MSEMSLGLAAYRGDLGSVRRLLADGVDPDEPWGPVTPLMAVVDEPGPEWFDTTESPDIVVALLDAGANVNAVSTDIGVAALHLATRAGQMAVRLLLDRGADPNLRTSDTGETPLHFAVSNGSVESIELLLDRGADPSLTDVAGRTPLECAMHEPSPYDDQAAIINLLRTAERRRA